MRRDIVKGLLIDLSGTIHIDKKEIPGAVEAIRKLRKSGLPYRYEKSMMPNQLTAL